MQGYLCFVSACQGVGCSLGSGDAEVRSHSSPMLRGACDRLGLGLGLRLGLRFGLGLGLGFGFGLELGFYA